MPPDTKTMISVEQARSLILRAVDPLPAVHASVAPDSSLDPRLLASPILARDLYARWSLPADATSMMDGFALRARDAQREPALAITGESAAGHPSSRELGAGEAMAISTGAVVPHSADMVVPIEDCEIEAQRLILSDDARARASEGRFVRPAGSDIVKDTLLLRAGSVLGAPELALLVAGGHHELPIHRPARVAIVATGDELLAPGSTPQRGQLIETNAMMLAQMCREAGAEVVMLAKARDERQDTCRVLKQASQADLILSSGGISVGEHDWVARALDDLGFETVFRKVRLRPGKPTTYARLGPCHMLALPGNPASTYVAFELFARPLLRRLAGAEQIERPRLRLPLACTVHAETSRDHYLRARLVDGTVHPLATQVSGALTSLATTDVLAILPAGSGEHPAASMVDLLLLRPLAAFGSNTPP